MSCKETESKIDKLLVSARQLPDVQQRKVAAILGACVADAASRPLHWVYDMNALHKYLTEDHVGLESVDRNLEPEFFPENKSPFYSLPTGENSCYFDITKAVLESLVIIL